MILIYVTSEEGIGTVFLRKVHTELHLGQDQNSDCGEVNVPNTNSLGSSERKNSFVVTPVFRQIRSK